MEYMPEDFPEKFAKLYPVIYNYSYILAEMILTVIVINLPPVKKALTQIAKTAKG
jgi:thiamine transporter